MADDSQQSSTDTAAAQAFERAAQAHAEQAQELARLRETLLATAQEDLMLHRRTLETLKSLRREIEHIKRKLKALGRARA